MAKKQPAAAQGAGCETRPTVPARRDYKSGTKLARLFDLPFVRGPRKACYWHVTPTDDYGLACDIGREYAAHYAQFLKDNPYADGANLLGAIVRDIDFSDASGAKGYWVGFFCHLDRMIRANAQRTDVFADLDKVSAVYAEIERRRDMEAATEEGATHA